MFATRKNAAVQERFGVSPRHSLRRRLMIPLATILLVALLLFEASVLLIVAQIENDAWRGRQGEAARAEARAVNETVQQALDTLVYLTHRARKRLACNWSTALPSRSTARLNADRAPAQRSLLVFQNPMGIGEDEPCQLRRY